MSLRDFCFSVVYVLKVKTCNFMMQGCMRCFKSHPRKYFLGAVSVKVFKSRHALSATDEDFHLIIPVLLLLRTMNIYYMFMRELKFKKPPFCDYSGPCNILSCFLEKLFFLGLLKSKVDLVIGIKII